jgi:hypothetical protein
VADAADGRCSALLTIGGAQVSKTRHGTSLVGWDATQVLRMGAERIKVRSVAGVFYHLTRRTANDAK